MKPTPFFSGVFKLPALLLLFAVITPPLYAQKAVKASGTPLFTDFEYRGNDKIYQNHPLKPDEFYNPILQGCTPTRASLAKETIIIWFAPLLPCFPEYPFSIPATWSTGRK